MAAEVADRNANAGSAVTSERVTMGLLDYLTAHSLDEDYAHVSEQRAKQAEQAEAAGGAAQRSGGTAGSKRRRPGFAALLVLALFGLVVTTAALRTAQTATTRENSRESLIAQIEARKAELEGVRDRADTLTATIARLQRRNADLTTQRETLADRRRRLEVVTGAAAVTGPGLRIVVDDNPAGTSDQQTVLDRDLQNIANGLWEAGAEAIAINGQRLSSLSAIRHAGQAITVNNRSLSRPYTVSAIGNPNTLESRFVESDSGSAWLDAQASFGMLSETTTEENLTLPDASSLSLRYAHQPRAVR